MFSYLLMIVGVFSTMSFLCFVETMLEVLVVYCYKSLRGSK